MSCDHKAGLTRKRKSKADANYGTTSFKQRGDESTVASHATHERKQFFQAKTFYFSCLARFLSFSFASVQFWKAKFAGFSLSTAIVEN